jgi:hypothetical protein
MPAARTTEHDHPRTTPDQPDGHSMLGPQTGTHGDRVLHPHSPPGGVATAEAVNLRFDRIEDRLISLERMLSELLCPRCDPATVRVRPAPELQPGVALDPSHAEGQLQDPSPAETPPSPPWEQSNDDEALDVSVRDYVERLLKRGGAASLDRPSEASPVHAIEQPSAASQPDAESPPTVMEQPVQQEPDAGEPPAAHPCEAAPEATPGLASLVPRRLPPKRDVNLDAMRLVANLSATAAIRTYEKSQAARKTVDRLPLLMIGVICGLMLLYSAFSSGEKSMLIGAGLAFIGAALTAWQVILIVLRWLAASQPVRDP